MREEIYEAVGYVRLKFKNENRAINIYWVVISVHDQVEDMGVVKQIRERKIAAVVLKAEQPNHIV